ncbi:MAG: Gfo/Idh/MocA family oxidoreductase [Oscillospiraceae bacterium]|jgi:predicted dehydrogenase|nr:Gfo/Idh/MocA family oxidoreductase [Oscillospiraceae bacterium]
METTKVAVIGAGDISDIYLENLSGVYRAIEIAGIYSRTAARAKAQADKYGVPRVYNSMDELLEDPATSIVLNLTPPQQHFELSMRCLEAGKHVYTEKAMAATLEEGRILVETAAAKGLTICGAPDTFLYGGMQTMRKLLDDGYIGRVTGATAVILHAGHETWHANPAFFYKPGGGPMMDLGVYYLTMLVSLLGGVDTVAGMCDTAFPERVITSEPRFGERIKVETPTHVTGLMRFQSGVLGSVSASFDAFKIPSRIEIHGTRGMLEFSDGNVRFYSPDTAAYSNVPLIFPYQKRGQGLGLADQVAAIKRGRPPRAGGGLMLHILEVMTAFERSHSLNTFVKIESVIERPAPMLYPILPGIVSD